MNGVRWSEEILGYEGKCDECKEYWPLERGVFWKPHAGLRRCAACIREDNTRRARAAYIAKRGRSPEAYARHLARDREYKRLARNDPAKRAYILARQRAAQKRYYEKNRESESLRERARRDAKRGGPPRPGVGRPRKYPAEQAA